MEFFPDPQNTHKIISFSLNPSQIVLPTTCILNFPTYQALALQNHELAKEN